MIENGLKLQKSVSTSSNKYIKHYFTLQNLILKKTNKFDIIILFSNFTLCSQKSNIRAISLMVKVVFRICEFDYAHSLKRQQFNEQAAELHK